MIAAMEATDRRGDAGLMPKMRPATRLDSIRISGFRSFEDFELTQLPAACVLIGPNSSGKTNLVRFFEMLSCGISSQGLGAYLKRNGGADSHLRGGREISQQIRAEIGIKSDGGMIDYRFTLARAEPDRLLFTEEAYRFCPVGEGSEVPWNDLSSDGHHRARIADVASSLSTPDRAAASRIVDLLGNAGIYRFGDMSRESKIGMDWDADDHDRLRSDGGNLAAVLNALERDDPKTFNWICAQIRRMVSTFDQFQIKNGGGKVKLGWKEKGSDRVFRAHETSDGTLRIFALYTLLELSEEKLPDVVILDEPDLGLHHWALGLLAGMIRSLSVERQLIITTQSTLLLNEFDLEQTIILEAEGDRTVSRCFKKDSFSDLTEDAPPTTGQLYLRGSLGGTP